MAKNGVDSKTLERWAREKEERQIGIRVNIKNI